MTVTDANMLVTVVKIYVNVYLVYANECFYLHTLVINSTV